MTDEAVREIVRIRKRLAELEARLAPKEEPMTNEYPSHNEQPEQTRKRLAAESWRFDPEMEQVAALKRDRPEVFDSLPPVLKMAEGMYQNHKRAAREQGIDTSGRTGLRLDTATEGGR